MRSTIPGLATPHPIGEWLPALYQEDDFAQRFTGALDEVLAPVFAVLDCLDAYLDPWLAPPDFLDWLADWVALSIDEGWSTEQRRELVSQAVALHRGRGTAQGLAVHIGVVTGGEVEIQDSGGCVWSDQPGGAVPGTANPRLHVRVRVADPAAVDQRRLDALIAEVKPAHLPHTVEIVGEGTR
jgi:phage tail-like protein